MIRTVHLSYQRDIGAHLTVSEGSIYWIIMEYLGDNLFSTVTGHLFCCNLPEFAWKIRWGRLDEDGWTDRCLGHHMWNFGQWLISGCNAWRHIRTVYTIPVTGEWVREHYPDADAIFTGEDTDSGDAMVARADDAGEITL